MSDKNKVHDRNKPSAVEFDAENIQTDREKRRDGISEEDIRNADWGGEKGSHDPKGNPCTVQDAVQDH